MNDPGELGPLSRGQRIALIVLRVLLGVWLLFVLGLSLAVGQMMTDPCPSSDCGTYGTVISGALVGIVIATVAMFIASIRLQNKLTTFGRKAAVPVATAIVTPLLLGGILQGVSSFLDLGVVRP